MKTSKLLLFTVLTLLIPLIVLPISAAAQFRCSLCYITRPETLAEKIAGGDTAVLARWIKATPDADSDAEISELVVVRVIRQAKVPDAKIVLDERTLEPLHLARSGMALPVASHPEKNLDGLYLVTASLNEDRLHWHNAFEMSEAAYQYVLATSKYSDEPLTRLKYISEHLCSAETVIADDAFLELERAPIADLLQMAKTLPHKKVRTWFTATQSPSRRGLIAIMLGACGKSDDAELLKSMVFESSDDLRLGIDGIMKGYLLLTGERGLALIDEKKLRDKTSPVSESLAAMQAVRFMWEHGENRISQVRLRQSMQSSLDRPYLADLAIDELAQMKDWSVQDHLMSMYETTAVNDPSIKRAIIRFTLVAANDHANEGLDVEISRTSGEPAVGERAPHAIKARKCLEDLEKRDPKSFGEAQQVQAP